MTTPSLRAQGTNTRHPRLRELSPTDAKFPLLSLRSLARATGISTSMLSRVLNGKRTLTIANARRIAKALGVTTAQVVDTLSP